MQRTMNTKDVNLWLALKEKDTESDWKADLQTRTVHAERHQHGALCIWRERMFFPWGLKDRGSPLRLLLWSVWAEPNSLSEPVSVILHEWRLRGGRAPVRFAPCVSQVLTVAVCVWDRWMDGWTDVQMGRWLCALSPSRNAPCIPLIVTFGCLPPSSPAYHEFKMAWAGYGGSYL